MFEAKVSIISRGILFVFGLTSDLNKQKMSSQVSLVST